MQKFKSRKQNTQKLLAALVMGMNLVNTVTPAAAAMQNMPEQMEALPVLPKNEAQPLEYTVLPQALQCVESIVFGKAEAKYYQAGNLDKLDEYEKMTVSAGQVGSIGINEGDQDIFNGGTGLIDSVEKCGRQTVSNGGYGSINIMNGSSGQYIDSSGTGIINIINGGRQTVANGGYGSINIMNDHGDQYIYSGGTGIINTMNNGKQTIEVAGVIDVMNGGTQLVASSVGIGRINIMNGGLQVMNEGSGSINIMKSGLQDISTESSGSIGIMYDGLQEIAHEKGIISEIIGSGGQSAFRGTGIISRMIGPGYQLIKYGTGTILELNNVSATQSLISGGTSLDTTMINGEIRLADDSANLVNATVHGGKILLSSSAFRAGTDYKFGRDFTFDGGTVDMTKDWDGKSIDSYKKLTIENFKKGGGDFVMLTDLESEKDGDKLIINKADAGTSYIKVVDKSLNGTKPVSKNKKLLLVTVKDGRAAFAGKELNTGGLWSVTPTIERGDKVKDNNGKVIGTDKEWYLTNITQDVNKDTKVLLESSDNAYALWRNTNDTLRKRLGELRLHSKAAESDGIWARYNGGKFASDSFSGSYNMYQLGYDKADNEKSIYGFALEKGSGKGSYSLGSSKDKLVAGSLYGVWTGEDGSYTDVTAKVGQFDSDVKSHGDYPDKADYRNRAYSLSVEYGKTIELSKDAGTFIEPQAQFIAGHMASAEYTTDRGNRVYLGNVNSYIGRLGFVLGQKAKDGNEVYLKASALREFGGDRDVSMVAANGEKMSLNKDYGDTWFELGLGTNIKLSKAGYFYGDVERSFGAEIKKKWQINAGLRWSF